MLAVERPEPHHHPAVLEPRVVGVQRVRGEVVDQANIQTRADLGKPPQDRQVVAQLVLPVMPAPVVRARARRLRLGCVEGRPGATAPCAWLCGSAEDYRSTIAGRSGGLWPVLPI